MMASPCQNCTFQHKLCETLMTLVQALDVRYFFSRLQEMLLPSCFFRLGTGNKSKGIISGVHSSNFDIDEKSLEIGIGLMAWLALNELNS